MAQGCRFPWRPLKGSPAPRVRGWGVGAAGSGARCSREGQDPTLLSATLRRAVGWELARKPVAPWQGGLTAGGSKISLSAATVWSALRHSAGPEPAPGTDDHGALHSSGRRPHDRRRELEGWPTPKPPGTVPPLPAPQLRGLSLLHVPACTRGVRSPGLGVTSWDAPGQVASGPGAGVTGVAPGTAAPAALPWHLNSAPPPAPAESGIDTRKRPARAS